MAKKKKTTIIALAAAQGGAKDEKKKELIVSDERMREILIPLADLLDNLHVKTHEDILVGREIILVGARQMLKDNPHIDCADFVCRLCKDIQEFLVYNFLNHQPVGEA